MGELYSPSCCSLVMAWCIVTVYSLQCPKLAPCKCRVDERQLNVMDCDNKELSDIPNVHTIPPPTFDLVTLRNNSIQNITSNFWDGVQFEQLDISYNILTSIDNDAFQHVKDNLTKLVLEGVGITFKNKLSFLENLTSLVELSLDDNVGFPIHLPNNFFQNLDLVSLKTLSLKRCQMLIIGEAAFVGLESVEVLDISHNNLSVIPSAILTLHSLKKLNISHNKLLTYIHDRAFQQLSNLREIQLGHSSIEYIEENAFEGLERSLEDLDLNHCSLSFGHFHVLQNLKKLVKLDLSYNRISHIRNESFDDLMSLEELDISGNPLHFSATMFRGLENKLKILRIQAINRSTLPLESLVLLKSLELLDASKNLFSQIDDGFFTGVSAGTIWLMDMKIKTVNALAFNDLKPPISVRLDNNAIQDISFIVDARACSFHTISLEGNPVICDCMVAIITKSHMVKKLTGTCANKGYTGKSIQTAGITLQSSRTCQLDSVEIYTCGAITVYVISNLLLVFSLIGSWYTVRSLS